MTALQPGWAGFGRELMLCGAGTRELVALLVGWVDVELDEVARGVRLLARAQALALDAAESRRVTHALLSLALATPALGGQALAEAINEAKETQ